jgi:serine/threonine-protein kinase
VAESDYQPEALVSRGTVADVYRAQSPAGPVVLKALRAEYRHDPARRLLLLDEGELLARLSHPNLVRCLEVLDGVPALMLETVPGTTVAAELERTRVPMATAVRVARGVAAALAYLHAHGVVHHGVLPANVMVTPFGRVVLLDLSHGEWPGRRVTITREPSLDNVPYACPELWAGARVGAPGDVYRLGVLFAHLLEGRPPALAARARLGRPHPGLQLRRGQPADVEALLARLTAREPADRPSAAQAGEALASLVPPP